MPSLLSLLPIKKDNYEKKPILFSFRSNTLFIIATVGIGLFTDLFLYGLVVPILPFILKERVHLPDSQIQSHVSGLLAAYAGASTVLSIPAGAIADKTTSRQTPFLGGLSALILATILLFTGTTVAALTFARLAQGASSAFVWTIGLALCIDTVGPENLGKTIGSIFSFITVGELFAPVLGGSLYQKFGLSAVAALAIALLVLDFVMRLLLIEKKVAARYVEREQQRTSSMDGFQQSNGTAEPRSTADAASSDGHDEEDDSHTPTESSPLLKPSRSEASSDSSDFYYITPAKDEPSWLYRNAPILRCLRSASLVVALVVALVQAFLLAAFDATIPTHAYDTYGFDSLQSSLLFLPLSLVNLVLGPVAGWCIDRYGTKPGGVFGYAVLVPFLTILRIPKSEPVPEQPIIYGVLLGFCGLGMAVIGAPSIVEAGAEVERFYKRNPEGVFSEQGPYAQLYGFNSLAFSAGLSIGPVVSGLLRERIGYGNMNAVLAGLSGATAISCWIWLGGKPNILRRWLNT
ncbi:MAG: hypothetical protein M1831_007084 [Alyxoria varia]|nr:MAG: hypothetical protein M1831_007084 [Alyxoria varia]